MIGAAPQGLALALALMATPAAAADPVDPIDPAGAPDLFAPSAAIASAAGPTVRIKDIAHVLEARANQLVGYGMVVGLAGTGDSARAAPFTETSLRAALDQLGIPADGAIEARNVASVLVTAELPHHARPGARIDATISAVGDAASLRGGVLVLTPLVAPDGETYAVAQGSLLVGGFAAAGDAQSVTAGVPTVGQLRGGALIERASPASLASHLTLSLRDPDFGTAVRVADAINGAGVGQVARELDAGTVALDVPPGLSAARFVALIESVAVRTDRPARVVVDERSGTVVVGDEVRIGRVAVAHGQLTVRVTEAPRIVQPNPFGDGVTAVEPLTEIDVARAGDRLAVLEGPSLRDLVEGLNALGVGPDGVIAILSSLKAAGALHAELVVQ